MHTTVTTTITSSLDLDSFEPDHKVDISAEDALPHEVIYGLVIGGCNATIGTIENQNPRLRVESFEDKVSELANEEIDDAEFRRRVLALLDD